jgi:hypothetical protein
MKVYNNIKKYVENTKGIITIEEFKNNNISEYFIKKLIFDKIIEKYSKGIYIKTDTFEDEYYIFQQKNKKVVFSYNTAMYFLKETESIPEYIDVTVYKGYNVHRFSKNVKVHYTNKENINLGVIKVETFQGFEVLSYNRERILCDLVKNRNTGIDKEQSNKFIKEMFINNKIDTIKLLEYSKRLKCEKKIREIMEVLM